jgi:hypothetical protein
MSDSVRLLFLALLVATAGAPLRADVDSVLPVLEKYCVRCHKGAKPKGKVHLGKLTTKQLFLDDIATTRKILEVLESHDMPPKKEEQPSDEARATLVRELGSWVGEYIAESTTLRPVVMRRLNRYEYNNAVRDLLELEGDIYPLPEKCIRSDRPYFDPASGRFPDVVRVGNRPLGKFQVERQILTGVVPFAIDLQSEHGFNNRGDELSVSPILLEAFLELGQSIVSSPRFDRYCGKYAALFTAPSGEGEGPKEEAKHKNIELASTRIRALLERAFRGPVDGKTHERYTAFFERSYRSTGSFSKAMKQVVSGVLASPRFLYLVELKKGVADVEKLSDHELATRLSFFIWSTIPDVTLLDLAKKGELSKPDVLEAQVRRMIRDKRSKALAENFARQWLRLDRLITAVPDKDRFPTYYSRIGCEYWKFGLQTMVEPLLLFESILVEDSSVFLLVDSDYSYRSDELQHWYRSPNPFGHKGEGNRFNTNQQVFKRRKLESRREGGVITSAAVMTMNSSPLRTSPIARGAWVATVIFNRPPAPPPDDIPEIEADDEAIEAKGLTIRERLIEHQASETCAGCHSKIDPLGFALENYDAVGRWRERYKSGRTIDASGKIFGTVEFHDIVSFKDAVLAKPERFLRAFCEHMLSYALGRGLTLSDEPAVDEVVRRASADGGRFSTFVVEIATSHPFLHKTNQSSTSGATKREAEAKE